MNKSRKISKYLHKLKKTAEQRIMDLFCFLKDQRPIFYIGLKRFIKFAFMVIMFGLFIIFVLAAGIAMLVFIDKEHASFTSVIKSYLGTDNYFNGELWFSAAVTFMGAVISAAPGLLCGVVALVQTKRLHDLEDRYHAPMMELEDARLDFYKMDSTSYYKQIDRRVYKSIEQFKEAGHHWLTDLHIVFNVKNDIVLKSLRVDKIVFSLNGQDYQAALRNGKGQWDKSYSDFWSFERHRQAAHTVYTFDCSLNIFQPNTQDNANKLQTELEEFILYSGRKNLDYQYMVLCICIIIQYEYNGKKGKSNILRMTFDSKENQSDPFLVRCQTENGWFSYEQKWERIGKMK